MKEETYEHNIKVFNENAKVKLKTLKDLRKKGIWLEEKTYQIIKAEAVKWVKHCYRDLKKTDNSDREAVMFLNGEIFAFEHFFNITEEDLK